MFDHETTREHMSYTLPGTSLGHVVGLRWTSAYQLALGGSISNVRDDATDEI